MSLLLLRYELGGVQFIEVVGGIGGGEGGGQTTVFFVRVSQGTRRALTDDAPGLFFPISSSDATTFFFASVSFCYRGS